MLECFVCGATKDLVDDDDGPVTLCKSCKDFIKSRKKNLGYTKFCEAREQLCGSCPDYLKCPATPTCFSLLLTKLGFKFERGKQDDRKSKR